MSGSGIYVTCLDQANGLTCRVDLRLSHQDLAQNDEVFWLKHLLVVVRTQSNGSAITQHLFADRIVLKGTLKYDSTVQMFRYLTSFRPDDLFPKGQTSQAFYLHFQCFLYRSEILLLGATHGPN
ncbi:MAG: hypothetical protein KDC71_22455 [Acidobacteria bacterium]|nr:hypothetical protein [Acidobacteriota bacterium]